MMMIRRRGLAPLVLLLALAGCSELLGSSGDDFQRRRLAEARALWESSGPASYGYEIDLLCACVPATAQRTVRVTVADGASAVAYAQPDDGPPQAPPAAYQEFATVEKLFAAIEAAISRDQQLLQVSYDQRYGFPDRMNAVFARDDQVVFLVGNFLPAAP